MKYIEAKVGSLLINIASSHSGTRGIIIKTPNYFMNMYTISVIPHTDIRKDNVFKQIKIK